MEEEPIIGKWPLSTHFQKGLDEVACLIDSQLNGPFLLGAYESFVKDCWSLQKLTEIELNSSTKQAIQALDDYELFLKEDQASYYQNNHALRSVWNEIRQKFNRQDRKEFEEHCDKEKIKKILKQGLRSIKIVTTPSVKGQGSPLNRQIFIHINHEDSHLSPDQFLSKVLKPYISVCIYRELGNYLIRQLQILRVDEKDGSFILRKDNVVARIYSIVNHYKQCALQELKPEFNYIDSLYRDELNCRQSLKQIQANLILINEDLIPISEQLMPIIRKNSNQIDLVKQTLWRLQQALQLFEDFPIQWFQTNFEEINQYLDKLLDESKPQDDFDQKDSYRYKIFFAFYRQEKIMKKCLPSQMFLTWNQISPKIPLDLNNYCLRRNSAIQDFLKILENKDRILENNKPDIYDSQKLRYLVDDCFRQQKYLYRIIQQVDSVNFPVKMSQTYNEYLLETYSVGIFKNGSKQTIRIHWKSESDLLIDEGQKKVLETFDILLKVRHENQLMKKFMKWSQLLQVAYELPVFFYSPHSNQQLKFECGYQIERRLFPCLYKSNRIYEKDYQLIKQIQILEKRSCIGIEPKRVQDSHYYCRSRDSTKNEPLYVDLSQGCCGNHFFRRKYFFEL